MLPFQASTLFQPSPSKMTLATSSTFTPGFKGLPLLPQTCCTIPSSRLLGFPRVHNTRLVIPHAANMAAGQSDGPGKLNLDRSMEVVQAAWESMPQPVKNFPWIKAFESFTRIILELVYVVAKYLSVPLLAVSSLSEMSYCAQERKLILVPIPLAAGFSIAGVLKDTAMELSPELKKEDLPWHLLLIAVFFIVLKLLGPHYPYWARIFVPHFANGGLWRTLWFVFLWFRRPREHL